MDILAVASVQAGGAGFDYNKGCANVFNSGVGQIDITLNNPADEFECVISASPLGKDPATFTLEHISDTVKRVNCFVADPMTAQPTASDTVAFTFTLIR